MYTHIHRQMLTQTNDLVIDNYKTQHLHIRVWRPIDRHVRTQQLFGVSGIGVNRLTFLCKDTTIGNVRQKPTDKKDHSHAITSPQQAIVNMLDKRYMAINVNKYRVRL